MRTLIFIFPWRSIKQKSFGEERYEGHISGLAGNFHSPLQAVSQRERVNLLTRSLSWYEL